MRTVLPLVWLALIVGGGIWAYYEHPPDEAAFIVAPRTLVANTLILPSVAVPDAFAWRYVAGDVPAGTHLHLADLAAAPMLGTVPIAFVLGEYPVDLTAVLAGLNAGGRVRLCGAAGAVADATVTAVRCVPAGETRICSAVVRMGASPDRLKALAAAPVVRVAASCEGGS